MTVGVVDVQPEHPRSRGVDGHRRVHLADRDLVEQGAHVATVDDGHTDLADFAPSENVVGVVTGLGRQVEGDRQAGLALGQVGPIQLVGGLRRGVTGIGPHHPGAVGLVSTKRGHAHSVA